MKRYFIRLSYNGACYCGWQNQPNGISVQRKIEETLGTLLRVSVAITGAGRTDAGVHAKIMYAHFDFEKEIDLSVLAEKMNRILPNDIAIRNISEVRIDAHARFDAISRTYQYFVTTRKDPFNYPFYYKITHPLDLEEMNKAARILFDYIDFTSFSKLHTDVKTNNCKIMQAEWNMPSEESYVFTIKADRFLRNMVRAIVGTLIDVGRGKISQEEFRNIIESKNRSNAGTSVPGNALFLTGIEYREAIFDLTGE